MPDQSLSLPAKLAALEILALVQRTNDLTDADVVTSIGTKVQDAIDSAGDAQVGLLRYLAQTLTPAAMEAEGSGAAIVRAVKALRDAGITCES
jgi:hypothetical protein